MNCKTSFVALVFVCLTGTIAAAEPSIRAGDRIAIIGNTFADQLRIHGYLETLLLQHTEGQAVSVRNFGWGGDMLSARDRPIGFPTEESALTAHKTDVIIACFGMGESYAGESGLDEFKRHLNQLIDSHAGKKYNGESAVRLVLVSPIACEDQGKLTPLREKRNRDLQAYTRSMQDVVTEAAADANVSFVDLYEPSRYLMDEPTGPKLTNNGIHLNPYGYWAISHTFFDQLTASDDEPIRQPWRLRIDAVENSYEARGVEIFEMKQEDSGLRFQVLERSAPRLRPPTNHKLPSQLESMRDTLVIANLPAGTYRLIIDDQPIATATAGDWSEGVAIDSSPAHQAAERYHAVVNDKNLQFTYSWKALNQVHIVGQRRHSPSGRELPKEVIEFNRLANELDKTLAASVKLRKRKWRVLRIGG